MMVKYANIGAFSVLQIKILQNWINGTYVISVPHIYIFVITL